MVGKRLGRIVAQKKRALTAMHWREVGMGKGTKRAQDSEKKVRGENMGNSQTQQCVGERLDRETKRVSEKKKKKSERREHSSLTAIVGERLGRTGAWKKQGTRILAEEDYTTVCKFLVQKALKEV